MIAQVLANVFGGAFTGYITNVLAVKMLFKKYPIVGGGVILDNYEEFVKNMSALVERDLINHATLEHEFQKDGFKTALETTVSYLLNKSLYNLTPDIKLSEVDGFSKTYESYKTLLEENEPKLLSELLSVFLNHIDLEDVLSSAQIDKSSKNIFNLLEEILGDEIGDIVKSFYDEFSNKKIDDLIEPELIDAISSNIDEILSHMHEQLREHDAQIDTFMDNQYVRFKIDKLLYKLQDHLKKRSLFDIIGGSKDKNVQQLSDEIIEKFISLINSQEAQPLLVSLSESLIEMLTSIEHPISHYVDEEIEKQIYSFLQSHLPTIIEFLLDWVLKNRHDIEELIETLVDETLSKGGVLGRVKLILKDIFIGKFSGKFSLIERFESFANLSDNKEEAVQLLHEKIMFTLKENSIGDIVSELQKNGFIDAQLLADIMKENMKQLSSLIRIFIFDELFHMPLSELTSFDLVPIFSQILLSDGREIFKEKFLYTKSFSDIVRFVVKEEIERTKSFSVSDLLQSSNALETFFTNQVNDQKETMTKMMNEKANSFVKNKKVSQVVNENLTSFILNLANGYYQTQKSTHLENFEQLSVYEIYKQINSYEDSVEKITELTLYSIDENLHCLLEGNVSETVKKELHRLSPKMLQEKVEEFMGEELGPITWLGAGLGATVGATLSSVQTFVVMGNYSYIAIPLIYGVTGIVTNSLALKMLFRPHKEVKIAGMIMPFTPGIVAKKKPKFAKNMSLFVDKSLLTKEGMHKKLLSFEDVATTKLHEYIAKDEYAFLESLIEKYSHDFSLTASKMLGTQSTSYIQVHHDDILKTIMSEIDNFSMTDLPAFINQEKVLDELNSDLDSIVHALQKNIRQNLNSSKEILEFMPSIIQEATGLKISFVVNEYSEWLYNILKEPKELNILATSLLGDSYEKLGNYTFVSFLTPAYQVELNRAISGFINTKLTDKKTIDLIVGFVQRNFLNKDTIAQKKVGELFDGALINIISNNISLIFSHAASASMQYLKDDKENVKEEILTLLKEESGFLTNRLMGFTGIFSDVERLIDIFIDERLIDFYEHKQQSMDEQLHVYVENLSDTTLQNLGIKNSLIKVENLTHLAQNVLDNSYVQQSVKLLSHSFMDELLKLRIKTVASMLNLNTFENVLSRFSKEINLSAKYLCTYYDKEREKLQTSATELAVDISTSLLLTQKVRDLVRGVKPQMLMSWIEQSKEKLINSDTYEVYSKKIMNELLHKLGTKKIDEIIDLDILKDDISNSLKKVLLEKSFQEYFDDALKPIIEVILKDLNRATDEKTKEFFIKILLQSAYDSVLENADILMESIDFKDVIEKEINNMHPSEIEEMFNSFAKIYFDRLILYGGYGALFGIPVAMMHGF